MELRRQRRFLALRHSVRRRDVAQDFANFNCSPLREMIAAVRSEFLNPRTAQAVQHFGQAVPVAEVDVVDIALGQRFFPKASGLEA